MGHHQNVAHTHYGSSKRKERKEKAKEYLKIMVENFPN